MDLNRAGLYASCTLMSGTQDVFAIHNPPVIDDNVAPEVMLYVRQDNQLTHALGRRSRARAVLTLLLLINVACVSQQRVDPSFRVTLPNSPTYPLAGGPVVWIDEAHNNEPITAGRYAPFAEVLEADGYVVRYLQTKFTTESLKDIKLLVIIGALHDRNLENSSLIRAGRHPTESDPMLSAFSQREIVAVNDWVVNGGALLLLAEHMPVAGATAGLAESFGFRLLNGFVEDPATWDPAIFRGSDGTLVDHSITRGWRGRANIESVATFDGAAFTADGVEPLLIFGPQYVSYQPDIPWEIDANTPTISVAGWFQGAVKRFYDGRLAVFGDATMFSAQLKRDGTPMGMNSDAGKQNLQFLLNVLHWLMRGEVQE